MNRYVDAMAQGFEHELQKIARAKLAQGGLTGLIGKAVGTVTKPTVLLPAAGIAGWEALRRANEDRKIGRQMRMRSGY